MGGFAVAAYFNRPGMLESTASTSLMLQNIFIGVILTATFVSISVETLKEMGKLNTRAGNAILGAAIIDDILGIIALTIITSLADSSVNVFLVLGKIVAFFVFVGVGGYLLHIVFQKWVKGYERDLRRFVILAFRNLPGIFLLCRRVFRSCRYYGSVFCGSDYYQDYPYRLYCQEGSVPCPI